MIKLLKSGILALLIATGLVYFGFLEISPRGRVEIQKVQTQIQKVIPEQYGNLPY